MPLTNFPNGISSFGIPVIGAGPVVPGNNVYFVSSVTGGLGDGTSRDFPLATLAAAVAKCSANKGDVIFLLPGHAETISAAGGITISTAGITVVGLGEGASRPTFTFGTAATASFLINAANFKMTNVVGIAAIDALTKPFNITAAGCVLDIEFQDGSTVLEADTIILTSAAADNLTLKLKHIGFTGGSGGVAPIKLVGCNDARIILDLYGQYSTAAVNFITTACSDVNVSGYVYNTGVTDGSKIVVDTITGSTWFADVQDGAASARFSGGSGSAMASDDVSSLAATQTVPVADAATNVYMRDVVGIKTDAAVTTVATTKSLMAYLKGALNWLAVGVADAVSNASAADVIGNKTDASVTAVNTTKSIVAYLKGLLNLGDNYALSATAVMVSGNTIFTVAGGPIIIDSLVSMCVTGNDATASTVQYSATPTQGSAQTISAASASVANAATGATVSLIGTSLATAALYNANGPNLGMTPNGGILVPAGAIKVTIGVGSTTGTWKHYIRYRPLTTGVTVS